MRSVEAEGSSIDEAIEKALSMLRVGREQVAVDILENSTRGLFGLGGRPARVRATVREALSARLTADAPEPAVPQEPKRTPPRPPTPERRQAAPATQSERATPAQAASAASPLSDELAERGRALLEQLLGFLSDGTRVTVRRGEDGLVSLQLSGDDGGILIGRRGQTLDALEHLLNRLVFRDASGASGRIAVDVEGYRARREESLQELALRLAAKAKERGRSVTLNPMSPRDRRIVHVTLQQDPEVTTRSQGEGHFRKIVITPQQRARPR